MSHNNEFSRHRGAENSSHKINETARDSRFTTDLVEVLDPLTKNLADAVKQRGGSGGLSAAEVRGLRSALSDKLSWDQSKPLKNHTTCFIATVLMEDALGRALSRDEERFFNNVFNYVPGQELSLEAAGKEAGKVKAIAAHNVIKEFYQFLKEIKPLREDRKAHWRKFGGSASADEMVENLVRYAEVHHKNFGKGIRAEMTGPPIHPNELIAGQDYQLAHDFLETLKNPAHKKLWKRFLDWLRLMNIKLDAQTPYEIATDVVVLPKEEKE